MPRLPDEFEPAWLLSNGHANTLFSTFFRGGRAATRRERVTTPDGDFFDLDVADGQPGKPTLVLLHGLEGSSASGYMQYLLAACAQRGWTGVAMNYRSCSGEPNLRPRSYHSGETGDVELLLSRLSGRVFLAGFSLGGSVVLNLLARLGGAARVTAAVAVSTPYDLAACARLIDGPGLMARLYQRAFLPTLKAKALVKAARFPGVLDPQAITKVRTLTAFDHEVTAKVSGFASGADYYARCSTAGKVKDVRVPTLLISAEDDPIAPAKLLPPEAGDSPHLHVLVTKRGGHVGFVAGTPWAARSWGEETALAWLERFAG